MLNTAAPLLDAACNAWVDHGTEDEFAAAFLYDEVLSVLEMPAWRFVKARRRIRKAAEAAKHHGKLAGDWTNAVPMLRNMPRTADCDGSGVAPVPLPRRGVSPDGG